MRKQTTPYERAIEFMDNHFPDLFKWFKKGDTLTNSLMAHTLAKFAEIESSLTSVPVVQWEYKIGVNPLSTAGLNELGKDGWELCSTTHISGYTTFYFKRPLKQQDK